jgi:chromosome segregation ATPase
MFEAEVKSNIIKIATLEQELKSEYNERRKLELEFSIYKDKQEAEYQKLIESRQQLEQSLKNSKTNEALLNSEMDHLRQKIESYEGVKLVDKDKEVNILKKQLVDLNDERNELKTNLEKSINDLRFDLESKNNELSNLESQIESLNEQITNMGEVYKKLDELRKENCLLQNRNKDLEFEASNQKDNSQQMTDYMAQSNKIEDLERENRKLKSEIDYLK